MIVYRKILTFYLEMSITLRSQANVNQFDKLQNLSKGFVQGLTKRHISYLYVNRFIDTKLLPSLQTFFYIYMPIIKFYRFC